MKLWTLAKEGGAKSFTEIYLVTHACKHFTFCLSVSLVWEKRGEQREGREGSLPDNMENERTAYRERSLVKILIAPPI